MIRRAHERGLIVIGGTIIPFGGFDLYHPTRGQRGRPPGGQRLDPRARPFRRGGGFRRADARSGPSRADARPGWIRAITSTPRSPAIARWRRRCLWACSYAAADCGRDSGYWLSLGVEEIGHAAWDEVGGDWACRCRRIGGRRAGPGAPAQSCHGGQCSWSITRSRTWSGRMRRGCLYRLSSAWRQRARGEPPDPLEPPAARGLHLLLAASARRHPPRRGPFAGRRAGLRCRPAAFRGEQRKPLRAHLPSRRGLGGRPASPRGMAIGRRTPIGRSPCPGPRTSSATRARARPDNPACRAARRGGGAGHRPWSRGRRNWGWRSRARSCGR